jgi:Copper transport outer membrane protein, MctB
VISFRFHLVSLVAVFLALGLGVLTGTTVLNRGIVTQLEQRTDQLAETSGRLREEVRDLQTETDRWSRFGEQVMEYVVDGRLAGTEALLITQEGTDTAGIDRVRRGLDAAGAELRAVLSLDDRLALQDESDVQELTQVLGVEEEDPEALSEAVASVLADRLALGVQRPDVLDRLLAAEFLLSRGPGLDAAALENLGGPEQVIIVVAGGRGRPIIEPQRLLVPLVDGLVEKGALVVAAEALETEYPFVTLLRSDGAVSGLIATQDNVDQIPGELGFVLALENLVIDREPGHYGVKEGADRLLPPAT